MQINFFAYHLNRSMLRQLCEIVSFKWCSSVSPLVFHRVKRKSDYLFQFIFISCCLNRKAEYKFSCSRHHVYYENQISHMSFSIFSHPSRKSLRYLNLLFSFVKFFMSGKLSERRFSIAFSSDNMLKVFFRFLAYRNVDDEWR